MENMENIKNYLKENKPFVVLLVGTPLSGKSTFVKTLKEDLNFNVISRDDIVMEFADTDNYNDAFNQVDQKSVDITLKNRLISSPLEGKNIIIDMTNLSSKRRRSNLNYFDSIYTKVAIIFPSIDKEEFIKRNSKRKSEENKNISLSLWNNMVESFVPVKKEEGFNKIFTL